MMIDYDDGGERGEWREVSTKEIFAVALRQFSSRFLFYSSSLAGLSRLFVSVSVSASVYLCPSLSVFACLSLAAVLPPSFSPSLPPPSLPPSLWVDLLSHTSAPSPPSRPPLLVGPSCLSPQVAEGFL